MTEPAPLGEVVDQFLDEKSIEHLDFDPLCRVRERGGPECGRTVAVMLNCRRCDAAAFICRRHYELIIDDRRGPVRCKVCGLRSERFIDVFRATPIGGNP